ncbi:MAG TPA: peptide deformylase [Desulfobacterales bacterium]
MMKLEILTYPEPFLHEPAEPVEEIDESLQQLIENMAQTMYEAPGVGLAATQIGDKRRVFVYDRSPSEVTREFGVVINPKIVTREGQLVSENEGCLSVPDLRSDVKRSAQVLVEGIDREGNPLRLEAEGFLAVVMQHEIDHLNGTLFIDRISALKRELYKRRMKKRFKSP